MVSNPAGKIAEGNEIPHVLNTAKTDSFLERQYRRFENLKERVNNTLVSARTSPYGRENIPGDHIDSYERFRKKIPLLTPEAMKRNSLDFVRVDEDHPLSSMRVVKSSSSTGNPKTTYHAEKSSMSLSKDLSGNAMDILKTSDSIIFIHENKNIMSYGTVDSFAEKNFPNAQRLTYKNASDFIESIQRQRGEKKTIYLTSDVSSLRSFIDQLKQNESKNPNCFNGLNVSEFFVDIVAEPINIKEIAELYKYLSEKFNCKPKIATAYSSSEFGLIGLYIYKPGDTEIRYKVKKDLFVESLDFSTGSSGEPVFDKTGDIVITALDKNFGSIYPRYVSGDKAKITIDEEGNMYIGEVGRDETKGQIILRGGKIYALAICDRLKEQLSFPVQIQFQKLENSSGTKTRLVVTLSSDRFKNKTQAVDKKTAIDILNKIINEEFPYRDILDINRDDLEVVIQTIDQAPEDFNKAWRILPEVNLEVFEQQELTQELQQLIRDFKPILASDQINGFKLLSYWKRLMAIINSKLYIDIPEDFYNTDIFKSIAEETRKLEAMFEILDEQDIVTSILRGDTSLMYERLGGTFEFAKKEAMASKIDDDSRVLFIGSGSVPISVISYVLNFDCFSKVVGKINLSSGIVMIDKDPKAVENAKQVVAALGLSDKIQIQEADGSNVDCHNFTHIVLANMVDNKDGTIETLSKNMRKGTKLLCRSVSGLRRLLYEPLYEPYPKGFDIVGLAEEDDISFNRTIIFQKK